MAQEAVQNERRQKRALFTAKLTHTAVWAVFVACILALPYAGWMKRFDLALLLTALILIECVVLALNRGQCPLTKIAGRYTADRSPAFDIYLPEWLAERNKMIFGTLFVVTSSLFCGFGTGKSLKLLQFRRPIYKYECNPLIFYKEALDSTQHKSLLLAIGRRDC